jgi:hypothetical protein
MPLRLRIGPEETEEPVGVRSARAQVFWPRITKWSLPLAVAWIAAMSLPAFGSDQPWAQTSSLDAIFGR